MNYKAKYNKYKNKYLQIKKIIQKGGMNCLDTRYYKNVWGTCWMIAIQMVISFGDVTKDKLEQKMLEIDQQPNKEIYFKGLIDSLDCNLKSTLPTKFFYDDINIKDLVELLNIFYTRYNKKIGNDFVNTPTSCELLLFWAYKRLTSSFIEDTGNLVEQFLFSNILSVFFLGHNIYFANYTRNKYKNIVFNPCEDIGILISIEEHVCCFYTCGNQPQFYNDSNFMIFSYDWMRELQLSENEDLFLIYPYTQYNSSYICKLNINEYLDNPEKYKRYKRVYNLSLLSKSPIKDNINDQILDFLKGDEHKINDFLLLYDIGYKYYENKQYTKSFTFLKKSADQGYYYSQEILGYIYYVGSGVERNYNKAIEYLKIGYELCHNEATLCLGISYYEIGNFNEAIKYLTIARENGNTDAQSFLDDKKERLNLK
jgi:hypothetical protein